MPDEAIYAELGESLYRHGRFEVLGQPAGFLSLVYPALIGPLLSLDDLEQGYAWTKLLQALVMSLTAVPVYLWARTLAARGWALVAAALTLAIPGLAYSGLLMTEVAFYPVLVLAAWAMARALARPTLAAQLALVAAVAVAAMTRLQAFALVPVFVTALALEVLTGRRPRDVVRFLPSLGGLFVLCAAWAGWRLHDGGPLSRLFGGYEPAGSARYGLGEAAKFAVYHAADLLVLAGIFPVCAVAVLWAAGDRSADLRAYLAVASGLALWLVAEVGVFASGLVGYLAERNLLPLAPVLFVGFAAWLDRGGPRPRVATALTVVAVVALVLVLPVGRLVSPAAFPNSFTLLPLIELERHSPGLNLDALAVGVAAAALVVFALLPRRLLWLLPATLAAALCAVSIWASKEVVDLASFSQRQSVGFDRRWIDRRADGRGAYVYLGELNWPAVWQNVFWNRSIARVYGLLTARVVGGLPNESIGPLEDGRLVLTNGQPADADYAVAAYPVTFRGAPIATGGEGLVLWRLARPFRLSSWRQRVAGHIRVLVYACGNGSLRLELEGPPDAAVELRRNERPYRKVSLAADGTWAGSIPADPQPPVGTRVCTFDVLSPPEVVAPTLDFVGR
jgi:hypothetical protein